MRLLLLFHLIIFPFLGHATTRQEKLDSLLRDVAACPPDTNRVNKLNGIARMYMNQGDFGIAEVYVDSSITLARKLSYTRGEANGYNVKGVILEKKGYYPAALKLQLMGLKLRDPKHDFKGLAVSYNNVANVQMLLGQYEEALVNYHRSIQIKQKLGDRRGYINTYNNIGLIYFEQKNFPEALRYFKSSLEIAREFDFSAGIANALTNIGIIMEIKGALDSAMKNQLATMEIMQKDQNKQGIASACINITKICIKRQDFAKAQHHLDRARTIAVEGGILNYIDESYLLQSMIDSAQSRFNSAFENYKMHILYKDSVINRENTENAVRQQMQFEFEMQNTADSLKQVETEAAAAIAHTQKITRQKLYTWGGGLAFVLMLLVFGVSYRAYRTKQKANYEIREQKQLVEEKQREILDSIHYARRIQVGLLPSEKQILKLLDRLRR